MANIKITELDAITTLASTDVVPVVDVSADETHKITAANLFRTLPDGTAAAPALAFSSDAANGVYLAGTDTVGISTGGTQRVTIDGSGNVTISGDLQVDGATTTVQSTTVTIDDKNIELGSVATPTDTTADGGGITLKGATDHTIIWTNSTDSWDFSEHVSIASGKEFRIAGTKVLDATSLGSAVVSSSLTSVGTLTALNVSGNVDLGDNNKILLGTGDDLEIYHDGSNSYIKNNTGMMRIHGTQVQIKDEDNNETLAVFHPQGACELYYDNSKKLETKSDGIGVTGEVECTFLDVNGNSDLSGNLTVGGLSTFHGNLDLQDSDKILLGAGDDLEIYHDGSNSYIKDAGTGNLLIQGSSLVAIQSTGGETIAKFTADGASVLNYDGAEKFATKSDGVDITGELLCDSLGIGTSSPSNILSLDDTQASGGVGIDITNQGDGGSSTTPYVFINAKLNPARPGGEIRFGREGVYGSESTADSFMAFYTAVNSTNTERARIDSSGRLLLGTTTEGEASADNLTIADTGNCGITIRSGTSNIGAIYFSDATSGAGEYDGRIDYSQSGRYLSFSTAQTERFRITSTGAFAIEGASNYGTSGQVLTSNGNDAPTWQDAGAAVVGGASAINMNDNVNINFGAGNDLQIYSSGTIGHIKAANDDLRVQTSRFNLLNRAGTETLIDAYQDSAVELYYNNSKKFETKSDGVDIVGELQCDSLDVDGAASFTGGDVDFNGASYQAFWDYSQSSFRFQDNATAEFGTGEDLRIYHNGTNSYIENQNGDLYVQTSGSGDDVIIQAIDDIFLKPRTGENGIQVIGDGPVKLAYNSDFKFETTSSGIDVTGTTTSDVVNGTQYGSLGQYGGLFGQIRVGADVYGNTIKAAGDTNMNITVNNAVYFNTGANTNGSDAGTTRAYINSTGFIPNANNTYDLGTSSFRWRNVYTNDLNLSNEGSTNDVDGTWGNYTIQEGEDDLFLINRRNGKKYKFNLTEVS